MTDNKTDKTDSSVRVINLSDLPDNPDIKNYPRMFKTRRAVTENTVKHIFEKKDSSLEQDLKNLGVDLSNKKTLRHLSKKNSLDINAADKTLTPNEYYSEENILLNCFEDQRPQNNQYFEYTENFGKEPQGLAVVIPFFNEPSHELQQTLHSLYASWNYLRILSKRWRNEPLHICLIQDGWNKADWSMREYLKTMFPKKIKTVDSEKYWWEYYDDFNPDKNKNLPDRTFIFQKKNQGSVIINPQEKFETEPKFMRITLVIKTNNRRKHNSHEWFLGKNGFAESVNSKYLFLTDAFTLFNKTCMWHLVKALDKDKKMIGVTGRQRVMTNDQQGSSDGLFSLGRMLRMVQLYDFESSNTIYNPAFSIGGLLPVIPGPCGLYRTSNLLDDNVRSYYFNKVYEEPDKTGLVLGNLKIAEDRILSYASVIKSSVPGAYMALNTLAIFYFEAETKLDNFIFQRRRWINGSVAGYIYLLFFNFNHFTSWNANIFRKAYIWLLLMFQLITYLMISIAPSIQIKILYTGINYFLDYYGVSLNFDIIIIGVICWAIYFLHIFVHNRIKFSYIIMYLLLLFSFAAEIISIVSLLHYAFVKEQLSFLQALQEGGIILYLGLYVLFGPLIGAILLSGKGHSFMLMIKGMLSYLLFLPMLIAWFGSYSYARLWDLTWGNRPASEMEASSAEVREKKIKKFKIMNIKLILILAVINIALYFVPLSGQLIIMAVFFAIASYQLTLSIIYCLVKTIYKIYFVYIKCIRSKSAREVNII